MVTIGLGVDRLTAFDVELKAVQADGQAIFTGRGLRTSFLPFFFEPITTLAIGQLRSILHNIPIRFLQCNAARLVAEP
jgi:hypothetical protein